MNEPEDLGTLVAEKDIPLATQLNLIKRRTERGLSPAHIARIMGLEEAEVQAIIQANGWAPKRKVSKEHRLDDHAAAQVKKRDEVADIIRNLAERGMTRQDVADITGKSRDHVNLIARTYGIKFEADQRERREKRAVKAKYRSRAFYKDVMTLRDKGWSVVRISHELGVSHETVRKCMDYFKDGGKS